MPINIAGAKRAEIHHFHPEALASIRLGLNLRRDLGTPEELQHLAQSLGAQGQLQPGLVRRTSAGEIELVAGFRRLAAMKLVNEDPATYGAKGPMQFRATVLSISEDEALEVNLRENLDRRDLSPVDLAAAARNLEKLGWDEARIAELMRMSTTRLKQITSLLTLPAVVQTRVHRGALTEAAARGMLGLDTETVRTLVKRIDEGEKPAEVLRVAEQAKRDSGQKKGRGLPEIRTALGALDTDQAVLLLAWVNGEPGVELKHVELDNPLSNAASHKALDRLNKRREKAEATADAVEDAG